jgi:hypothetical protein
MKNYNKVKWALGLFLVFFLIIATNLIDKNNFKRIRDSVVTIYEDRLIAQDLILKLKVLVQEKEMAFMLSDTSFFKGRNTAVNREIEEIIGRYLTTRLTDDEERIFSRFQTRMGTLLKLESSGDNSQPGDPGQYKKQIGLIKENLQELSEVQLEEGRRQSSLSKEVLETVELFTQIEIYVLVFLAILIQILVIYTPKKSRDV